jgi:excisionase family DNA binding protein
MNDSDTKDFLTIPEAADFLRLRPSTIRAWILQRRIPYLKLGGRVCLRRVDLEALVERSLVPAISNWQDRFKSAGTSPPARNRESVHLALPRSQDGAK